MKSCWQLVPIERPSFSEIVAQLSNLQSSTELQEQIRTIDTKLHSGDLDPLCSPSRAAMATHLNLPGSLSSQEDSNATTAAMAATNPVSGSLHDHPKAVLLSSSKDASLSVSPPPLSIHVQSHEEEEEYDYVERGKEKLFKLTAGKSAEKGGKGDGYENSDLLPFSASLDKAETLSGSMPDVNTSLYYNLPRGYLQAMEPSRSKSSSNLPGAHAAKESTGKDHDTSDDSESDISSWLKTNGDDNTYLKVVSSSVVENSTEPSNDMAEHTAAGPALSMVKFKQSKPSPPPKPASKCVSTSSC